MPWLVRLLACLPSLGSLLDTVIASFQYLGMLGSFRLCRSVTDEALAGGKKKSIGEWAYAVLELVN